MRARPAGFTPATLYTAYRRRRNYHRPGEAVLARAKEKPEGGKVCDPILAPRYRSSVGTITLTDKNGTEWVDAGFIEGPVATRKNADGSVSLVSAGPGAIALEALIGSKDGARTLTVRDSQHEYLYTEVR